MRDRAGLSLGSLAGALLHRPSLWPAAIRMVPPRWWRHWPPLPVPPGEYLRFRLETMYGSGGRLDAEELIRYLEWCRRMDRPAR